MGADSTAFVVDYLSLDIYHLKTKKGLPNGKPFLHY
jgi:hypothetical protein